MKLGIEEKRALATGAGHGIGRSISLCSAREGARVAVVSRTAADIETLVDERGGAVLGHYGVPMLEGHGVWHHKIPDEEEYKQIMEVLS